MAATSSPVLCLSVGQDLKLWDTKSYKAVSHQKLAPGIAISRAVFAPRGDCIAVVGKSEMHSSIYLLDATKRGFGGLAANDIFQGTAAAATAVQFPHVDIAFSNSSTSIACARENGLVEVFERRTAKITKTFPAVGGQLSALTYSSDDAFVISGDDLGDVTLRSATDLSTSFVIKTDKPTINRFRTVPYSDSGICTAHCQGAVCLVDLQAGEVVRTFEEHLADCRDVAFSPINPAMAVSVGLDNRIVYYDMREKKKLNHVVADCSLTSATFLPSGDELLCGTSTGKLLLFDLRAGSNPPRAFIAHTAPVICLILQPDRKERPSVPATLPTSSGYTAVAKKPSPGMERRSVNNNGFGSEPSSTSSPGAESKLNRSTSMPKAKIAPRPVPATAIKTVSLAPPSTHQSAERPKPVVPRLTEAGQGDLFRVPSVPPPVIRTSAPSKGVDHGKLEVFTLSTANGCPDAISTEKEKNDGELTPTNGTRSNTGQNRSDGVSEARLEIITKALEASLILETHVSALDVQDVVQAYGDRIEERVWDIQDEMKILREEMRTNSAILKAVLEELRLLRNHMPY